MLTKAAAHYAAAAVFAEYENYDDFMDSRNIGTVMKEVIREIEDYVAAKMDDKIQELNKSK